MAAEASILFVEDDSNLLNSVAFILRAEGFRVLEAPSGERALELAAERRPDLVLLDLMLPGIDGFEVAEHLCELREAGTRIVILTGSDLEDHIVRALDTCADDYVVKPVRPRVLLARVRAVLRRGAGVGSGSGAAPAPIEAAGLRVDEEAHVASVDGVPVPLTPTEFRLLRLFVEQPRRALHRRDIIRGVHGSHCVVTERSVDFLVHGLRRKLGDAGKRIATVRGIGFKLRLD